MSLSPAKIVEVVGELNNLASGAVVQKITAISGSGWLFSLRRPGRSLGLLVELSAGAKRIHLVEERYRSAFERAPDWIMVLRAELGGWRFDFAGCEPGGRRVVLRHSRGGRVKLLGCDLFGVGAVWIAGKGQKAPRIVLGKAVVQAAEAAEAVENRQWPVPVSAAGEPRASRTVERAYLEKQKKDSLEKLRGRVTVRLNKEKKRLERLVAGLERDLNRCGQADELRHSAEVLKANLGRVPRGLARVELEDFARPGEKVTIELDPALDATANMQRLFSRARRLGRGLPIVKKRLERARLQLSQVQRLLRQAGECDEQDRLELIAGQWAAGEQKVRQPRPRAGQDGRKPFREFVSASEKRILVGRSAADNHKLTFSVARGHDLWFHARGTAGAHVVVFLERGQQPDSQTMLDAATLAALYSGEKNVVEMDVTYARVKHLRPVKGEPGRVWVSREKVLRIRVEYERVERLKASMRQGKAP